MNDPEHLGALGGTATSREWQDFRETAQSHGGDWGLPRGTYEGELREVTTVRRKDTGQWVLRMLAYVPLRQRYALAWVELSNDPRDPYELSTRQLRGLEKVANALGVRGTVHADELLDGIAHRVGEPVDVRVVHTPIGPRATLSRSGFGADALDPAGMLSEAEASIALDKDPHAQTIALERPEDMLTPEVVTGEVVAEPTLADYAPKLHERLQSGHPDPEKEAARMHEAHTHLLAGLRDARHGLIAAAQGCYVLLEHSGWEALGCDSLREYLAAPEVGIARSTFYDLANIHRRFVLEGGVEPERLALAEHTKLAITLPALKAGTVTVEEALADAEALGFQDVRTKYRELMRAPDDAGKPDPEPNVCAECGRPL